MRKQWFALVGLILLGLAVGGAHILVDRFGAKEPKKEEATRIPLPTARYDSSTSLESVLQSRRSIRDYAEKPLSLDEAAQLMWAAQGITNERGHRTAPSAGALYPLEVYLLIGEVEGLEAGVYKYLPSGHELLLVTNGDRRFDLYQAALKQESIKEAPVVVIITAIYERTEKKYGNRATQYVHIEVGSAAQNIYLQATAMDLGTVFIGAFHDQLVITALGLEEGEEPLGLMPVGKIR